MDPSVDSYIDNSQKWPDEMSALRPILLGAGLDEAIKWNKPCYSSGGSNIAIMQEMKDFLALMFFKGALLDDPQSLLEEQGPNSRSAKRLCFRSVAEVESAADAVRRFVGLALEVEDAGIEVAPAPDPELVDELVERLAGDPELAEAFDSLTPGRRREYNLYFAGAKQAKTRTARIDKSVPKILEGKGFRDR